MNNPIPTQPEIEKLLDEWERSNAIDTLHVDGYEQWLQIRSYLRTLQAENKSMREYIRGRTEIVKGSPFDPEAERIYRSLSSQ